MSTIRSPQTEKDARMPSTSGLNNPPLPQIASPAPQSAEDRTRKESTAMVAALRQETTAQISALRKELMVQVAAQATQNAEIVANAVSQASTQASTVAAAQMSELSKSILEQLADMRRHNDALQAQMTQNAPPECQPVVYPSSPPSATPNTHPTPTTATNNNITAQNVNTATASTISNTSSQAYSSSMPTISSQSSLQSVNGGRQKVYDLPSFDGHPEDWQIFVAEFNQSTAEYGYTDAQNASRLRKSLHGSARDLVSCLLVRPDNVQQAMDSLERQFGKPQYLVASQVKRVREIAPIDESSLEQFVPLAAKVATMVAFLDAPKTRQHLLNPMIIEEILQKLPQRERREWARFSKDLQPYPSLKDMSRWLDTVAEEISESTLQYPVANSAVNRSASTRKQTNRADQKPQQFTLFAESTLVATAPRACGMCSKNNHTITECYWFVNLNSETRWNAVKSRRLCGNCLEEHNWRQCNKKKTCGIEGCASKHHPLLHPPPNQNTGGETRPRNPFAQPSHGQDVANTAQSNAAQSNASNRGRTPVRNNAATRSQTSDRNRAAAVVSPRSASAGHPVQETPPEPAPVVQSSAAATYNIRCAEPEVLLRVVPVKLSSPTCTINTYALFDEGSTVTLIDEDVADELGLDGPPHQLHLNWVRNQSTSEQSRIVRLRVSGTQNNAATYELNNVHTFKRMKLPTQSTLLADLHTRCHHLRHLPIAELNAAEPKLLIGLAHCNLGLAAETIGGENGGFVAARTKLGWTVFGQQRRSSEGGSDVTLLHARATDTLDQLHRIVSDYFTTEDVGIRRPTHTLQSDEEAYAWLTLEQTTKRVGERFQTGLLWKKDHVQLPPSYQMAMRRLLSVEAKMRKDATYSQLYRNQMQDYLRKGFARQLTDEEAATSSPRTWYLPHFAVVNANKPGKFRLVFDAAASVRGISLNSALSSGPDLHKPLPDILFAFRVGIVAVSGDIREMFCQIRIQESDQDAQRFLWRDGDAAQPVRTYVMTCMTFGATCSPCSAHYVKNRNAEEHRSMNESAVRCITDRHYVDDYVASFSSANEAITVTNAVTVIHKLGGFELRSFISNDRQVQAAVGGAAATEARNLELESNATDKVLGLYWDADADDLVFRCTFHRVPPEILAGQRRPTKREMLSLTMSVFDPFGMVANFMIGAKLLIQETWTTGIDWDDTLTDALYERWSTWQRELPRIASCRLPRCYTPWLVTSTDVQLHVFADSSELAYAAVAYWRVLRPDGSWDVAFVSGKTRCAPRKLLSIPRLELQAAVLAVHLSSVIRSAHSFDGVRVTYWSDSRTVVCWIRSHHRRYKPYVAHRIAEILEDSTVREWRWIPTGDNVADDATRPVWPLRFDPESRWLRGPAFLRKARNEWPQETGGAGTTDELPEEIRPRFSLHVAVAPRMVEYDSFFDYVRLRRMVGWVIRYVDNTRKAQRRGELEPDEVQRAELVLCRQAQSEAYASEVEQLRHGDTVSMSSSVYRLCPYLSDDGVMRLRGRIDAARQLPEDTRRPIILPPKHTLTEMIVAHEHVRMKHQNDEAVICAIRERFWIPHARTAVRRAKRQCQRCRIEGARPIAPLMGSLPEDRLLPVTRPFTYTGLDYFGPVYVTVGRRREKRWVALFTCLSIRAVHLELAADLTTDSCILCIRNFVNIRGVPVRIRSDNGTNFVGASKELRECVEAFDQEALKRECCGRGIEWKFNCPSNPEAGGSWERLVRSVKRVLAVSLTEVAPRVETMRSLLIEAANIVNSRPLTHIPVEHDDEEPLTPNHFLLGTANSTQTPGAIDPRASCTRKQWRIAQDLKNHFWQRWMREYLPELTRRTKWFVPTRPLMVDDLVVICDGGLPRSQWPRGRIIEVYRGRDGQVRTALVRTAGGELKRPACKLAVLDVKARSESENPVGVVTGGAVAERSAL